MNLCLIPTTRLTLDRAIESAVTDGWGVLALNDPGFGSNPTREKLLDIALSKDLNLIRYLDDDDTLYPHLSLRYPKFLNPIRI